jgi:hypothetical protein
MTITRGSPGGRLADPDSGSHPVSPWASLGLIHQTIIICKPNRRLEMFPTAYLTPLVSLIAGILILMIPRLLNYIVAIYLIVIGILGLVHH